MSDEKFCRFALVGRWNLEIAKLAHCSALFALGARTP